MRKIEIMVLINFKNKVNTRNSTNAAKLDLQIQKTYVNIQKIDSFFMETYGIFIASLKVFDSLVCLRFFKGTFLLAEIKMKVIFGILFLTYSNVNT